MVVIHEEVPCVVNYHRNRVDGEENTYPKRLPNFDCPEDCRNGFVVRIHCHFSQGKQPKFDDEVGCQQNSGLEQAAHRLHER